VFIARTLPTSWATPSVIHNLIKPDPERLKPLLSLAAPTNSQSLKRILGFFAHYAKWVPKFSDKIQSLINTKDFPLDPKTRKDFEILKGEIGNAVITTINDDSRLTVETDASDFALAATLSQEGRPVAFFSRTLSKQEKHHPAIEKEAAAIMEALRKWKSFLLGRTFTLVTDQQALSFIFNKQLSSKIKKMIKSCDGDLNWLRTTMRLFTVPVRKIQRLIYYPVTVGTLTRTNYTPSIKVFVTLE